MQKTLQSNVFYANLCAEPGSNVQGGTRPVIVVSNEDYNRTSDAVTIIPLSTRHTKSRIPTHVWVDMDGLPKRSLVLCEQINTIDKKLLRNRIGSLNNDFDRRRIARAVEIQLGLDPRYK